MSFNQNFLTLYNAYTGKRKLVLNPDAFMQLVSTLPALLVAKADGKVDDVEKRFLHEIAKGLATDLVETKKQDIDKENLADLLFNEFSYILDNLNIWQIEFIDILAEHLEENPEMKPRIEQMINNIAEISEGICADERIYIQQLVRSLKLRD